MNFDFSGVGISNNDNSDEPDATPIQGRHRRRRQIRVPPLVTQLSDGSGTDISEYEDVEVDEDLLEGMATSDVNGIKFLY